jgi:hypothetical protein
MGQLDHLIVRCATLLLRSICTDLDSPLGLTAYQLNYESSTASPSRDVAGQVLRISHAISMFKFGHLGYAFAVPIFCMIAVLLVRTIW